MIEAKKYATMWSRALLPTVTIVVLVALKSIAAPLYRTHLGHFPAMMIEVLASRTVLFDWSPAGYYEELFVPGHIDFQKGRFGSGTFIPDSYRLRRFKPNLPDVTDWYNTYDPVNRFGYIGPQWAIAKPANTRRIAVLGDSVTEGFGVSFNQGYVYLLTDRLNATVASEGASERYESLNFAVSAYHLTQMMDVATHDVPPFQPDVYVVVLTALSVYRSWDAHLIYLVQSGIDVKDDFLRDIVARSGSRRSDDETTLSAKFAPYRMSVIRRALAVMKANAEQQHAQFLVVLMPVVEDGDSSARRFEGIPELLSSMNITFVDLSDTFTGMLDRQSIRISRTDIHPNALGHKMISDNLYEKLRANPDAWSKLVGSSSSDDH